MTKVSIVILTFNSSKFIKPCLNSVFSQEYQDFEVILIDNDSSDNTVSLIKENYPTVRLIENEENLGVCKARNRGIELANGEWILTLDCDIVLEKDFLNQIVGFARESDESIGILQPKIFREDKKTIYSYGVYLSKLFRRFYDIGKDRLDYGQFDTQKYIFGACCAAALHRKTMLEKVKDEFGYFDERFFFLVEDVDLAWRTQQKNYKTLFVPEALCYHAGNSSNTNPKLKQYLCFRNGHYMIKKNNGYVNLARNFLSIFMYDLPRSVYLIFTNPYILKHSRFKL